MVREIPWKVFVCKEIDKKESLGIYLYCTKDDESSNWSYVANSTFKLFNEDIETIVRFVEPFVFNNAAKSFGVSSLIEWDILFDVDDGFVKNDTINLEIQIEVADPNEVNKTKLICTNIEKSCNDGCLAKMRLKVENIENFNSPFITIRFAKYPLVR